MHAIYLVCDRHREAILIAPVRGLSSDTTPQVGELLGKHESVIHALTLFCLSHHECCLRTAFDQEVSDSEEDTYTEIFDGEGGGFISYERYIDSWSS